MNTYPELDDLLDYSLARLWSELDEADDRMCILRTYEECEDPAVAVAITAESLALERYCDRLTRALLVVTGAAR